MHGIIRHNHSCSNHVIRNNGVIRDHVNYSNHVILSD